MTLLILFKRKFMFKISTIVILLLLCFQLSAQELNCNVKVIYPNLQTSDPKIFQTLETSIYEFMNNRKWTSDNFEQNEKIDCSLLINITEENGSDKFKAQVTIQSSRPVYNSSYKSTIFNWVDKDWNFQYAEYQPLEFNENSNLSNLTSMLSFYAYIMIGFDYDSYSLKGGNPYFQKAQKVVNNAQNSSDPGWKSYENLHNRYWLVANALDSKFDAIHQVYYNYHRMGMDNMYEKPEDSRKTITNSLNLLSKLHDDNPNAMILQVWFSSKADELVNIYSGATPTEKTAAVNLLAKLDPSNSVKYQNILKSK